MAWLLQIWDHAGEPARPAQGVRVGGRHGPVTDVLLGVILAQTVEPPGRLGEGRLPQVTAGGIERCDNHQVWEVREPVATAFALDIFEEQQMLTMRAVK